MVRSKGLLSVALICIIISKIAGFIIDNRIISDYRSEITHFFFAKIFALNRAAGLRFESLFICVNKL